MAAYIDPQGREVEAAKLPQGTQIEVAGAVSGEGDWLVRSGGVSTLIPDRIFRDNHVQMYPRAAGAEPEPIQQQRCA